VSVCNQSEYLEQFLDRLQIGISDHFGLVFYNMLDVGIEQICVFVADTV